VPDRKSRTVPQPFDLHWGRGLIAEEATFAAEHHEPAIQLLEFDDGSESVRFCYYDHAGRFQRSPLIVPSDGMHSMRKALAGTPRIRKPSGDGAMTASRHPQLTTCHPDEGRICRCTAPDRRTPSATPNGPAGSRCVLIRQAPTSDRFFVPQNDIPRVPSPVPSSQFQVPNFWLLAPNSLLLRSLPCP
jgi:hypothetical protein